MVYPEAAVRTLVHESSGQASSPSHQLSKQGITRLHDHLRHLYVRPLKADHDAVWHQQLQLPVVERAQSQDSLEHRQDVSDKAGLILAEHDDTLDLIHCVSWSRNRHESEGVDLHGARQQRSVGGGRRSWLER